MAEATAVSQEATPVQEIEVIQTNPTDERVNVDSNLKEAQLHVRHGKFIAEAPETIRLLLRSPYDIHRCCSNPPSLMH